MSRYYLLQDAARCTGCLGCQVHCKTAKGLGPGPVPCANLTVVPAQAGGLPAVRFVFMACFHCEEPWCLSACPSGAIRKRPDDGIVFIDPKTCVGCKSCIVACPWGACQWNPVTRKAVKCDYCMDRIDEGLRPACVTKCLTGCLEFGVAEALPDDRRRRYARLVAGRSPESCR
ncbi:MAG: 4Fe-4S dicluster domain-containing protein [bacterium]